MYIKYFKNGNINIKFDPDEIKGINALEVYRTSCIENEALAYILDSADLDFILSDAGTGCAGNYNMYYQLNNAYTGLEYLPLDTDLISAAAGKTLKLYGHKISDTDLAEYYAEYYG